MGTCGRVGSGYSNGSKGRSGGGSCGSSGRGSRKNISDNNSKKGRSSDGSCGSSASSNMFINDRSRILIPSKKGHAI
jgi:hypothetical protein